LLLRRPPAKLAGLAKVLGGPAKRSRPSRLPRLREVVVPDERVLRAIAAR
jgi:hypothetical protein